jgi:hypothetical protein
VTLSDEVLETCVCMCAYCVLFFSAIESNEECTEEGGIFVYQEEEDQGQAEKGKPSNLMHI